jgi:hypothetical protein
MVIILELGTDGRHRHRMIAIILYKLNKQINKLKRSPLNRVMPPLTQSLCSHSNSIQRQKNQL